MKKLIATIIIAAFIQTASAQVAINTTAAPANASAMLDVSSSNKGLLIPRIALTGSADVTTITAPQASLLIYNTATAGAGNTAVAPGY